MSRLAEDEELKKLIIELNTQDQLYNAGVDSTGKSLGPYSPKTVKKKQAKGQRTDHVTLYDLGDFYNSFRVFLSTDNKLEIFAITEKPDKDLAEVYGPILGLTDDSLEVLRNTIRKKLPNIVLSVLQNAA